MAGLRDTLELLSNEIGPSGREKAVRNRLREMFSDPSDRFSVDALGNAYVYRTGAGDEPRLRVLVAAHMDEVGFIVTRVEKSGLLRFEPVGGLDARQLLAKRVLIGDDRVPGVIGAQPPHLLDDDDERRAPKMESLAIDIGAASEAEARAKVSEGDYGAFATRFSVLSGEDSPGLAGGPAGGPAGASWPTVLGKAFDDRAGCSVLVELLRTSYPVDLIGAFTVQEEVGLRGARVAAHREAPDAAIVLEGTVCDDLPLPEDEDETPVTRLGGGPAVTLMDRRHVSHPGLLRLLEETAAAEKIAIQYKSPGIGATDAGALHLAHEGVPAITVATPCRYIHGPAAILNLNDLHATFALVGAALRRLTRDYLTFDR
jgi:endoglucanase